jgi:hypothetical protein
VGSRPATAVKFGTLFDGQRRVVDVAFHVGTALEAHGLAVYGTEDFAEHNYSVARNSSYNIATLTDDNLGSSNVTLNLAIDPEFAPADDLDVFACDPQVIAEYHSGPIGHDASPKSDAV